jgi:hypothetical protein
MRRQDPLPEELLDQAVERSAILAYALRHLASAWHRKHAVAGGVSWTHCEEHFCRMAHAAAEGRLVPATKTQYGVVLSVTEKEAS